ncbi:MAG: carboxypeptidase regulatory-like domain-containing protein [Planctomycetes bacterium]|nr:carboxypeptidase regulatory-like domain-containing protein [Planctomycetota bacterium]MCB9890384.1 carboxypeptidase regulatory-like domain-containing protein [Planctomycetota bacterium]MCB9917626.1 carboxypeptidase regulatory-like domain-containing protein [Planctomycetota bacterium]
MFVVVDRPIVCECFVVDPRGDPVAGASLEQVPESDRTTLGSASTGRDGRTTLRLTKADTYRIRVSKQGWATAQATFDPGSSEPWRITLQPAARVRVEVVDATAKPVPNAAVFACLEEDSRVCVYGHADGRGVVRFDDLVPGLWKFQVRRTSRGVFVVGRFSSDSLAPDTLTTKSAVLRAGSETGVTLTFGSLQKCTVRVRWKGRDLVKARVVFFDARGSAVSAFTNEQGRALLVKSGFGKGRVVVEPEGTPFTFTHELEVPRGRAESFETIDLAGATLVVIAPSGVSKTKPVQLFKGAEMLRITTPGRIVVEPVPPGVFTLRKQGTAAAAMFTVKAGDYLEKVVPNSASDLRLPFRRSRT